MPKPTPTPSITAGAVKLAALGKKHSFAEIARRIGKTEATVRHHSTGRRAPDEPVRHAYASEYGLEAELWTRTAVSSTPKVAAKKTARTPAPKSKAAAARNLTALEETRANIGKIDAAIKAAEFDEATSPGQLAQLFNSKTNATRMLAQLTGALDVSDAVLVASPAWQRIAGEIVEALKPHPDAAEAVIEVLTRFDEVTRQDNA